jgi:tetratricopeptide (TPR) repeat protein
LYMWQLVQASPRLSKGNVRLLLDEALAIADEVLASTTDDDALRFKAAMLLVQAERVEQDGNRRRALKAEGDRLFERSLESSRDVRVENQRAAAASPSECADVQSTPTSFEPDPRPLADVAVLYEKVLAKHPDCVQAHLALARTQRGLADQIKDRDANSSASRVGHLEAAATHLQRALDLSPEEEALRSALFALIDVLGPGNLNRPIQAEAPARAAIKRNPADPTFHCLLLRILLATGRSQETDTVLRTARALTPATAEQRYQMGAGLWDIVSHDPKLARTDAQKLLAEAVAVLDEALTLKPDYREALVFKKLVLDLQATRVEQDATRIKALRAEIERLDKVVKELMARRQP